MTAYLACGYSGFGQLQSNLGNNDQCIDEYFNRFQSIKPECDCCTGNSLTYKLKQVEIGWSYATFVHNYGHVCMQSNNLDSNKFSALFNNVRMVSSNWHNVFVIHSDHSCSVVSLDGQDAKKVKDGITGDEAVSSKIESCENFVQISAGEKHVIALTDTGHAGEIVNVNNSHLYRRLDLSLYVRSVSCGKEHVLLLTRTGAVVSYGIGGQGQLGHGTIENQPTPRVVEALEAIQMSAVAAGGWHSIAVSDIGDMYVWGWNERGQLGIASKIVREERQKAGVVDSASDAAVPEDEEECVNMLLLPQLLDLPDADEDAVVTKVACGSRHSAAITESGELYTWGWNEYGQLGCGDTLSCDRPRRVTLGDMSTCVTNVWCGCWTTVVELSLVSDSSL